MEGSPSHQAAWSARLERYEQTYLRTLRSEVERYSAAAEAFPDSFFKKVRSLVAYCKDGFILARYVADSDDFEFQSDFAQSIYEVGRELGVGDLRLKAPNVGRWFFEMRNFQVEIRDEGDVVATIAPDWFSFSVSNAFISELWQPIAARSRALNEVRLLVAAHALGLENAKSAGPDDDFGSDVVRTFEEIVGEFQKLIETSQVEAPLQDFLEAHPELLSLDYAVCYPKFSLGKEYITDFVLDMSNQRYILVEIEAATRGLYNTRGDPYTALTHAIQQVQDWFEWIGNAGEYIKSQLPGITEPHGWVVIGRRPTDPANLNRWRRMQKQQLQGRVRLFDYDELLEISERQLKNLRRLGKRQ